MHPMLNIAVKATRYAGNIINRASLCLEKYNTDHKVLQNYVIKVNQAAQEAIHQILKNSYPDHIVSFDGFNNYQDFDRNPYQWIVNSLDDMENFIHGFPNYAISVALIQYGKVVQAVVYDPNRNEIFTTSRGNGTFLNNRRIRISRKIQFQNALLGINLPCNKLSYSDMINFQKLGKNCFNIRYLGSTILNQAYVACGRLDGFYGSNLKLCSLTIGSLLVQEAGGLATDLNGEQDWIKSGQLIVAAPKILNSILRTLGISRYS